MKKRDDLEKLDSAPKFKKPKWKKSPQRPSIVSNYSVVSLSDVTEESLEVWRALPENIRQDPSLSSFRKKNERLLGVDESDAKRHSAEYDPLEREDEDKDVELCILKMTKNSDDDIINEEPPTPSKEEIHQLTGGHKQNKFVSWVKMIVLIACWLMFTYFLMSRNEKEIKYRQLSFPEGYIRDYRLEELPIGPSLKLIFKGALLRDHYDNLAEDFMFFYLTIDSPDGTSETITDLYQIPIPNSSEVDNVKEIKRTKIIHFNETEFQKIQANGTILRVNIYTLINDSFAVNFGYDPSPLDSATGIIYATIVLLGLYVLIIWELVHRTFAAIIASTTAIGILAAMNERPTMALIMSWIDVETLLLLFGMMILVAVLSETGLFDYLAVYAFKITNGRVWPLIICLCLFTGVLSSFLDNVTTILLMTPVTIRLCEVMELNPVPILMFAVIFSNIGGAATPVGDPPNVIIASNSYISKSGINFTNFTLHMTVCVILVKIQAYFQLRHMFRNISDLRFNEPKDIQELRHEITVWQRAAASLSSYSKDEDIVRKTLVKKVERLSRLLRKKLESGEVPTESYKATLEDLQAKYPIKNKVLLVKSCITLVFVISFFFLHSVPNLQRLSLGWTALLGAVLLLILYDREDLEAILAHVEWSTLLFFAALFVLMEALSELGLIEWIGKQTVNIILSVGEGSRLAVAILIILWVSALASAFVDNIPLTTMMVKIVISLSENEALGLPLQPLVWSLALGACLGGNGTLIGASANVVCAGVAEQHGYKFTFVEFFKVGFPVMIGSIIVATVYLLVAHVLFTWH